jgi:nitrite reductase (NADH) large subunit
VADHEGRKALHARFKFSQVFSQVDPWDERASKGVDAHEFAPLAKVG